GRPERAVGPEVAVPFDVQRTGDVTAAARADVAAPATRSALSCGVETLLDAGAEGTVVVHAPPPARQRWAPPSSTETRGWPRTSSTRKSHAACTPPSSS